MDGLWPASFDSTAGKPATWPSTIKTDIGQLVFTKQPASLVWKIARRIQSETVSSPKFREQHRLALTLAYRCLDEEVSSIAESTLTDALEASPHRDLSLLLTPALLAHLRKRCSPSELENIGLLHGLELGSFEDIRWGDTLKALRPEQAVPVRKWLRQWHEVRRPRYSYAHSN